MKNLNLYPRLALDGIRKNRRLYLPYILTCSGMAAMFYIINYFQYSSAVKNMNGGDTIQATIGMGIVVLALFSAIFLFYTNSFLIRRRKKEFGLYNILGMGKRNLSVVIVCETAAVAAISLVSGLLAGILLSKLAEYGLAYILGAEASYSFEVSPESILSTLKVFLLIFLLIMLNSLRQVWFSTAASLIKSESVGEKPPKANWAFGLLGIALLAGAYYIAVTITDPIVAMVTFFGAVAMVIVGTYLMMISGSVMFCRILQKLKRYYYKPNHFVSVSSMVYRMKRNGAGLASICILATMVLVMISSTASLYFGAEDSLMQRYPREYNMEFIMEDFGGIADENVEKIRDTVGDSLSQFGGTPENVLEFRCATVAGFLDKSAGTVETNVGYFNPYDTAALDSGLFCFYFVPLSDYNRMYGTRETLNPGEAMMYILRGSYGGSEISFNRGETLKIKKTLQTFELPGDGIAALVSSMVLVVPDVEAAVGALAGEADFNGDRMVNPTFIYNFDTGLSEDEQAKYSAAFWESFREKMAPGENGVKTREFEGRERDRRDFYSLYGGLFFLGIILSLVFIFAAVLIIYYKQISEGYEDRSRFEIMQKVGMTSKEIRKSINSQLLTVFFLPLIFAAMHLAFAFPIIRKILLLFSLSNYILFAAVTVICFVAFAALYTLVYKITSNAYYNIVSGAKEGSS